MSDVAFSRIDRLQVAQPQVRLVEVERALGEARLALERRRGQAPGNRKIEGHAAGGVVDLVDEERQQSDLPRAALHAAAERHVAECGAGMAQGFEIHGEVEVFGVAHPNLEPMAPGIGDERCPGESQRDGAIRAVRGLVGERGIPDLGMDIRDPGRAGMPGRLGIEDEEAVESRGAESL